MSTYIVFCRTHSPDKLVLAAGSDSGTSVSKHVNEVDGAEHTDIGVLEVEDDPKADAESSADYLARLQSIYQAQFT